MKTWLKKFAPTTLAGQIIALVLVAVLLGVGLATGVLLYIFAHEQTGASREALAAVRAARIAAIVRESEPKSKDASPPLLRLPHSKTLNVSLAPIPQAEATAPVQPPPAFVAAIAAALREDWGLEPLYRSADPDAVYLALDGRTALRFVVQPRGGYHNLLLTQVVCALAIIIFINLFLSIYAVRWIVEPLSSIASAAKAFGQTDREPADLDVDGPHEIARAAEALNEMRKRVRALVKERTQMLVAISHDLRTPLTRLRLRAERLKDEPQREAMLKDIVSIDAMLRETLAYLKQENHSEEPALIDLPSLIETIAAHFVDVGFDIVYRGPEHQTFSGRAQAIERAIANVVENATKFGARVEIALKSGEDHAACVEVSDDGPGAPPELLERMLEPFFKVDNARPSAAGAGFGLGLAITRSIVERHGGSIDIGNRKPSGLVVRLWFKPLALQDSNAMSYIS